MKLDGRLGRLTILTTELPQSRDQFSGKPIFGAPEAIRNTIASLVRLLANKSGMTLGPSLACDEGVAFTVQSPSVNVFLSEWEKEGVSLFTAPVYPGRSTTIAGKPSEEWRSETSMTR